MARHNAAEVLAGAAVLVIAGGFLAFAVAHSGRMASSGYDLMARFDHIDGLSVGNDVRMAGVKVGSVIDERIDPKTYLAVVTFSVADDLRLPKDTAAEIDSDSLLGGKYISLSPGGDTAMLQPGATITITQSAISLEDLLGKFIFSVTSLTPGGKTGQPGGAAPSNGTGSNGTEPKGSQPGAASAGGGLSNGGLK